MRPMVHLYVCPTKSPIDQVGGLKLLVNMSVRVVVDSMDVHL